jgi:hypothetical protein
MSNEDLGELIGSLTQAVERVRITVQLRRLASKKGGGSGAPSFKCAWAGVGAAGCVCVCARVLGGSSRCRGVAHMRARSRRRRPQALTQRPPPALGPLCSLSMDGGSSGGMTREAMRRALEELASNGHSRRATSLSEASSDGLM